MSKIKGGLQKIVGNYGEIVTFDFEEFGNDDKVIIELIGESEDWCKEEIKNKVESIFHCVIYEPYRAGIEIQGKGYESFCFALNKKVENYVSGCSFGLTNLVYAVRVFNSNLSDSLRSSSSIVAMKIKGATIDINTYEALLGEERFYTCAITGGKVIIPLRICIDDERDMDVFSDLSTDKVLSYLKGRLRRNKLFRMNYGALFYKNNEMVEGIITLTKTP